MEDNDDLFEKSKKQIVVDKDFEENILPDLLKHPEFFYKFFTREEQLLLSALKTYQEDFTSCVPSARLRFFLMYVDFGLSEEIKTIFPKLKFFDMASMEELKQFETWIKKYLSKINVEKYTYYDYFKKNYPAKRTIDNILSSLKSFKLVNSRTGQRLNEVLWSITPLGETILNNVAEYNEKFKDNFLKN